MYKMVKCEDNFAKVLKTFNHYDITIIIAFHHLNHTMDIRYIKHEDINRKKWDSCVHYATNASPYAYTWYLNNVCEEWDGIIEGDYESVFPLVWNNRLAGYKRLFQPQFCQQLGLFSTRILSQPRMAAFLEAIPHKFRYIDIYLNERNFVPSQTDFEVFQRPNYQLSLADDYDNIRKNYSTNLKRNLKKAAQHQLTFTTSITPETLVTLFRTHQGKHIANMTDASYHTLHRIIYNALHRGQGFITGIQDENGELCAAAFFLTGHGKIINLLPSSSPKGKKISAMHILLDVLIRNNAGRPVVLDFEGSAISSIARFYQSFGAKNVPYSRIKRNNLPFWLKWLKK